MNRLSFTAVLAAIALGLGNPSLAQEKPKPSASTTIATRAELMQGLSSMRVQVHAEGNITKLAAGNRVGFAFGL